jgi:DNA-directed RNA polymerase specialized sigma24 family protein
VTVTVDKFRSQTTQVGDTLLDFESLFREHWPRLYGVIYRLVGDHAEAEDLALESFWRLHQKIKKAGKVEALSTGGRHQPGFECAASQKAPSAI